MRVGPGFDVFVDSLEHRAAEFEFGVHAMHGGGELQVECGVIFGQHVLAIGLLAHLHVGNGIAMLFQISHLRRRVFGRAVEHGDGNHGGKIVGDATGEEQI